MTELIKTRDGHVREEIEGALRGQRQTSAPHRLIRNPFMYSLGGGSSISTGEILYVHTELFLRASRMSEEAQMALLGSIYRILRNNGVTTAEIRLEWGPQSRRVIMVEGPEPLRLGLV